jgi:CSLREA domain-containing protein
MKNLIRLCGATAAAAALCLAFYSTAVFSSGLRAPAPAASGATINVNTTSDAEGDDGLCTLREAIKSANADAASGAADGECAAGAGDDTITFSVTGPINLTSALPNLSTNITLSGPGANLLTVRRDTGGYYRVFTVPAGAAVNVSGLTVSNGLTADGARGATGANGGNAVNGGGILNAGTLNLTGVWVTGNKTGRGGRQRQLRPPRRERRERRGRLQHRSPDGDRLYVQRQPDRERRDGALRLQRLKGRGRRGVR